MKFVRNCRITVTPELCAQIAAHANTGAEIKIGGGMCQVSASTPESLRYLAAREAPDGRKYDAQLISVRRFDDAEAAPAGRVKPAGK